MKYLITMTAALALGAITCNAEDPAKPVPPPGAPPHAEGDKKPHGPGDRPHHSPEEIFKKLDTDNSGDISLDEFKKGPRAQKDPAKAEEIYKKMNTSNDGKLTLEQFKAAHHEGPGGEHKGPKHEGPGGEHKGPKPDGPKPE